MHEPFDIREVTREMVGSILLNPPEPHRHDHEELIIITEGKPLHYIDFRSEPLIPPVIVYIAQGKVHTFLPDEATRGWVIRYTADFIPQSRFNFYSRFLDEIQCSLNDGICSSTLNDLCRIMCREQEQSPPDQDLLRYLLLAVLTKLERVTHNQLYDSRAGRSSQVVTFDNFLRILEYNYKRPAGVDFYAEKLNMSTRNLNHISRSVFGTSITEVIETRKMIEARSQLLSTDKTIAEIGFDLGYNEKSYFTRVFRKRTGKTPSEFRDQVHAIIS